MSLTSTFDWLHQWLFEHATVPLLYATGLARYTEPGFDATEWFLIGAIETLLLFIVLAPLERFRPVQIIDDAQSVRTDVIYTLLHRLGAFSLAVFALVQPLSDDIEGALRYLGFQGVDLDSWWPGVTDRPWLSFLIYLIALDFVDYWIHRAQHGFAWWWQLHALHHAQRDMTLWSDQRNHLFDDLLRDVIFALVAIAVGVPPEQFVLLVVASRILQTVQHANVRMPFGWLDRILVSPQFHRRHHAIGVGHEGPGDSPARENRAKRWGVNYGVLLPWWDLMFSTADFTRGYLPCGVRDQLPGESIGHPQGRDYGRGFWMQQWLGLKRLFIRTA